MGKEHLILNCLTEDFLRLATSFLKTPYTKTVLNSHVVNNKCVGTLIYLFISLYFTSLVNTQKKPHYLSGFIKSDKYFLKKYNIKTNSTWCTIGLNSPIVTKLLTPRTSKLKSVLPLFITNYRISLENYDAIRHFLTY